MAAIRAAEREAPLIVERDGNLFAADTGEWGYTGTDGYGRGDHDPVGMAAAIIRRLVQVASRTFRPPGGVDLRIDVHDFYLLFLCPVQRTDAFDPEAFDPAAVWSALVEQYGGRNGFEFGYRQSAEALSRIFRLSQCSAVTRRRAGVVLTLPIHLDGFSKRMGRNCLSTDSRSQLIALEVALPTFASWMGDDDTLAVGAKRLQERFGWGSYEQQQVVSREKIALSDALYVTTYLNRFEFVMSPGLAEQLQVFLGLYGPDAG
jgi:hypothetical protein